MKSLGIQNFRGLETVPEKGVINPENCRDIQDISLGRGMLSGRKGYQKFNTTALATSINGLYDYKNRRGKFVIINDAAGNISSETQLTPDFVATPQKGDINLTVYFMDITLDWDDEIVWWLWDFGDGNNSTEQHPSHIYKVPGIYSVRLTVGTGDASFNCYKANFVEATGLIPDFIGAPLQGDKPLTVAFFDLTLPKAYTVLSRAWTFGDGGTSTEKNPTHEYTVAGQYDVQLTLTTSGASFVKKITDYVLVTLPTDDPEYDPDTPIPDFIGTPVKGEKDLTVQFTDLTVNEATLLVGTITDTGVNSDYPTQNWSTGIGINCVSYSGQIQRVFIKCPPNKTLSIYRRLYGGVEVVIKEVDPDSFDIATVTWNTQPTLGSVITTYTPPATKGWDEIPTGTTGAICIQLTDEVTSPQMIYWYSSEYTTDTTLRPKLVVPYAWTFGDGSTSTEQNPTHTYTAEGLYDVSLTVG